jgi:hypothetical protein
MKNIDEITGDEIYLIRTGLKNIRIGLISSLNKRFINKFTRSEIEKKLDKVNELIDQFTFIQN